MVTVCSFRKICSKPNHER